MKNAENIGPRRSRLKAAILEPRLQAAGPRTLPLLFSAFFLLPCTFPFRA
jgi:hypothetical protein